MSIFDKVKSILANAFESNPEAATAGEQDHSDPWVYAGEDATAPVNPGEDEV